MTGLVDAAISRSRTVISLLLMLIVAGVFSYSAIPKESEPDVSIGIIYVSLNLSGISPEDAERLMVRPVEEELRSIEGVDEMQSTAYEGGGNVVLEFTAGYDMSQALTDVREAVDRAQADLPADADEPTVQEVDTSLFPVMVVTLSGNVPERTLIALARNAERTIEGLRPVLSVDIGGDRDEVVEVVVDPLTIESYGLNGNDIVSLVNRSNRLVAAGSLDRQDGAFSVKVPGLFQTLDDILNTPIMATGDAVVRFRDVAEIRRTFKEPTSIARVDGLPAVALEVRKRAGENIIDTVSAIRTAMERESAAWPDAVQVTFTQDRSDDIVIALTDLQNNVIMAILLVMVVLVGALGFRSAAFVGVAIPGSFLTAILLLHVQGYTINIVVLFGLILAVGMLVDGAIVVTEFADRKMREGLDRKESYGLAAKRMFWPITASTATTLAAFSPLLFWPGVVGEFMKYLPITLIMTLSASLAMALIFVPTLGANFGSASSSGSDETMKALAQDGEADLDSVKGITGGYVRLLRRVLRIPGTILAGTVVLLVAVWGTYGMLGNGVEFFPDVEPEQAIVLVHARGNMSIHERDALMAEAEAAVLEMQDEFTSVYTRTGGAGGVGQEVAEDVIGQITIEFIEWDQRRTAAEIFEEIRQRTNHLAGVDVEIREPEAGPPVGKPVSIELSSAVPALLPDTVARIREFMETEMDGLTDIEDSRPLPGIDWELIVDRAQAAKFGIDVTAVGDSIQLVTSGLSLGSYRPDDSSDEVDIVIRYPSEYRTFDQLDSVRIETDQGSIPISNFVERSAIQQTGTIDRVSGQRVMTIMANVQSGVLAADKVAELRNWISSADLDPRIDITWRGEDEEQQAASEFLGTAFLMALFLMAIILLTQFNSFYSAFLILSAVIMSTIGVLIGLLVVGQPFGIVMTGVGIIALAGIVVNNNIVLIDTYDRLKETAPTALDALLRTGAQRFRPVMLTTITTVLGLLPMALGINVNFVNFEITVGAPAMQWWIGMATAIVFGLTFSTVLTLVVTPSALLLRVNIAEARARRRHRRAEAREARSAGADTRLPANTPDGAVSGAGSTEKTPTAPPPMVATPSSASTDAGKESGLNPDLDTTDPNTVNRPAPVGRKSIGRS
ncbi:efflux RND transporter permease subunit [Fodinicurvata sp. EGI_FJ10296]|uniref:efflux RND transporter permease subunit n=1 Tax=Fodinicurvata sp. EGI_FJ10296 TaxID=3231908 RepID=UPI0034550929